MATTETKTDTQTNLHTQRKNTRTQAGTQFAVFATKASFLCSVRSVKTLIRTQRWLKSVKRSPQQQHIQTHGHDCPQTNDVASSVLCFFQKTSQTDTSRCPSATKVEATFLEATICARTSDVAAPRCVPKPACFFFMAQPCDMLRWSRASNSTSAGVFG